jgi:hypothetical protein
VKHTHYRHPLLTSCIKAESFPGWVFVTRLGMPPHLKCSLVCCSHTWHSAVKRTSTVQPATGTPYPQVSQVSGIDLPVQKTKITAFCGDYHKPAAPMRHAAVQVDPQVVIWWTGLAHQQLIHILQHCWYKCQKHRFQTSIGGCRYLLPHIPTWHTSFQISTPWHAGPSMIWCWSSQPTHSWETYSGVSLFYLPLNKRT